VTDVKRACVTGNQW